MDRFSEIIKSRSVPEILIFDVNNKLLYSNKEALDIISPLNKTVKNLHRTLSVLGIPREIYNLCNQVKNQINNMSVQFCMMP